MIPEIANLALILAFCLILSSCVLMIAGLTKQSTLLTPSLALNNGSYSLIGLSFSLLMVSFIQNDFSVKYVASHSSSLLPLYYRIPAIWGGHEGSMLLWASLLALCTKITHQQREPISIRVSKLLCLNLVQLGILSFIITISNPFIRLVPNTPMEGVDLNPLLQDVAFLIHPPMLFLGYVGFTVVFAYAITALFFPQEKKALFTRMRRWTKVSWIILTAAITLGSWWAYRELGWGGWWFWDPVENASFLPWLFATALMHSLVVSQKRGGLYIWSLLLAILTFSMGLFGTFLVRSGLITSVHSFASDPNRGLYLLTLACSYTIISATILIRQHKQFAEKHTIAFLSRESFILLLNLVLVAAFFTVLLGTYYPLIHEGIWSESISVGAPYFNMVMAPIFCLLLMLMSFVPKLSWRHTKLVFVKEGIFLWSGLGILISLWLLKTWTVIGILVMMTLFWVFVTHSRSLYALGRRMTRKSLGMHLAHIGVAIVALGICLSGVNGSDKKVLLGVGESTSLNAYQISLHQIEKKPGPNYHSTLLHFTITKDNRKRTLIAEKRQYKITQMALTEASIYRDVLSDLYISLGEERGDRWSMVIYEKPFINLLWCGILVMVLGCALTMLPRRQRIRQENYVAQTAN